MGNGAINTWLNCLQIKNYNTMFAKSKTPGLVSLVQLSAGQGYCCTDSASLRTFTAEITKAGAALDNFTIDGSVVNPTSVASVATTDANVVRVFFEEAFRIAGYDNLRAADPSITVIEKVGDATKWVVTIRIAVGAITKATTVTPSDYNFTEV